MSLYSPSLSPSTPRRRLPLTPTSPTTPTSTPQMAHHKRVQMVRSADPLHCVWLSPDMKQPLRSQSFKHRTKPVVEARRSPLEDVSQERRRSTPTITRRCSLQNPSHRRASLQPKQRAPEPRTDVWPEPKQVEERFLKLPDSEDYTRVRQFKIDEKGAVVSRGDSFRRRRGTDKSPSPYAVSSDSARDSRSESVSSGEETQRKQLELLTERERVRVMEGSENIEEATTSHNMYKVYVVGDNGTGKSTLINQFNSSEYRNAFADDIEVYENTVSISLGGEECELVFFESDMRDPLFLTDEVQAFLILYSIDSRSSFKQAINGIEMIRNQSKLRHIPVLVAGNKADLERKRAVAKADVRAAAAQYGFEQFEISVALNHDVDDLLVGLVAEIKDAFASKEEMKRQHQPSPRIAREKDRGDDFHAAIRRYSQRKKKDSDNTELVTSKCSALSPSGFFNKLKQWRRGSSPRILS